VAEYTSSWWLSFADPTRPTGTQFLGACIIPKAPNVMIAALKAKAHGCNPGGEVAGFPFDPLTNPLATQFQPFKLYSSDEIAAIQGTPCRTLGDLEDCGQEAPFYDSMTITENS